MKSAYDVACAKLAARMRTEKEIRDFLGEKEYEKGEIDEAITDLKEFGYIDDKRYAVEYFRYAKKKSKAEAMIFRELAAKGIAAEFARDAIEDARAEAEATRAAATDLGGPSSSGCVGSLGNQSGPCSPQNPANSETAGCTGGLGLFDTQDFESDAEIATRLAEKMLAIQMEDGKPVDDKFLARVARRLASKGFSANTVYSTLADIKSKAREML